MAVDKLLKIEKDGSLSFGDHTLAEKTKVEDFKFKGDLLKVKTYKSMTKLERNGMFVYESVPGTTVRNYTEAEEGVEFNLEGTGDTQVTVGLEEEKAYVVVVNGVEAGTMNTNMGGKLSFNAELGEETRASVSIKRV
ncbi:MAG: endosialidase [Lachnospiraceae bacterium]|nr:endosialidase [Lachnospiraceae bacterium]